MARRRSSDNSSEQKTPRSLAVSSRGIKTGSDFAEMMSALMSDIIEGRISPGVGNATCNAGAKLLKAVEMQFRYGRVVEGTQERVLSLVPMVGANTPEPKQVQ